MAGEVLNTEESLLRVGAATAPQELAAAIAHACYEGNPPMLRAIGAGAVNQACKGIAIARQYVNPRLMDFTVRIGFATVDLPDKKGVSAMIFRVELDKSP